MPPANLPLRDLAEVHPGITLRGAESARHQPDGTHLLIRIGDISDDGFLRLSRPSRLRLDEATARRSSLRAGDVMLAARGTRMTAAVFDGASAAVVGSQFLVVRPDTSVLLPAYLRWFLNLPSTQENLNARARGSYVRSLSASALGALEIPLPPLPRQQVIADLHALGLREKHLMEALATRRATLLNRSILLSLGG